MRRAWALSVFVPALAMMPAGGCNSTSVTCPDGETVWDCTVPPQSGRLAVPLHACASNMASAIDQANWKLHTGCGDPSTTGTTCNPLSTTSYTPYPHEPTQRHKFPISHEDPPPSCDFDSADDACLSCVKSACCAAYQACYGDANCSCLVGCLYSGGSLTSCTSADGCGSPSAVTVSSAECLSSTCSASCSNLGSMNNAACGGVTGTGGSGAGGGGGLPTGGCVPGTGMQLAGNPCSSDADCESCFCSTTSFLCE
jgi:hypothetical protein